MTAPATGWMQRLAQHTSPTPAQAESLESTRPRPLASGILSALGLLWLAGTMWSAIASITGNSGDPAVAISTAALQLPVIIAATLLAGAATGLAAAGRPGNPAGRRLLTGMAAGATCGLVAAAVILLAFGANWAIGILAITVGVAGLAGGATAALPQAPLAAGIAATLAVFVAGALFNPFQSPLKTLLGAGATIASQFAAADRFLIATALISGLIAGLVAYAYLRRRGTGQSWPWYLLAGATPGLLLLVGEALTRIGGTGLLRIVGGFSQADSDIVSYLGSGRLVSTLIVGFTGGIAAMIAIGRTLNGPKEPADEEV